LLADLQRKKTLLPKHFIDGLKEFFYGALFLLAIPVSFALVLASGALIFGFFGLVAASALIVLESLAAVWPSTTLTLVGVALMLFHSESEKLKKTSKITRTVDGRCVECGGFFGDEQQRWSCLVENDEWHDLCSFHAAPYFQTWTWDNRKRYRRAWLRVAKNRPFLFTVVAVFGVTIAALVFNFPPEGSSILGR
jgi:hypothetical protein